MAGKAAHSVDDVGPPLQDGSDHRRVLDGVVLQVGILDDDDRRVHGVDGGPDGCPFAAV